jgi:hypothetical protein
MQFAANFAGSTERQLASLTSKKPFNRRERRGIAENREENF